MSTAVATRPDLSAIEGVLIGGDLSGLTESQRLAYYRSVCDSLGLNPLTQPFDYLKLSGKTVLYAKRDAAEQLRKLHGVSITEIKTEHFQDVYIVTAKAQDKTGRTDASTGVVPLGSLKGEALANALMKAETKAKRRVTLSICGLGMLDETEIETMPHVGYTVEAPTPSASVDVRAQPALTAPSNGEASGALTIVSVASQPTKNANVTKYVLVLSDGRQVTTIKQQLGALAEQIVQERCAVTVETKTSKWGEDLTALHRVGTAPLTPAPQEAF